MVKYLSASVFSLIVVIVGYLTTSASVVDPLLGEVMFNAIWLPTVMMAIVTGALLASSGVLIQVSLDNDFASPSTLGIASGALLGAVLARVGYPEGGLVFVWGAAFLGSASVSLIVLLVSRVIGGGKLPVVLVGMAIGLSAGAVASVFLLYFEHETDGLFLWGSGQVLQSSAGPISQFSIPAIVTLLLSVLVLPKLSLFQLGETHAHALGLSVNRWRRCILFLAVAQAALATAMVGMIGFIGLMAPHLARHIMVNKYQGRNIGSLWLMSLIIGAMLVLLAEWCSRSLLFLGYRLPTGAFAALIGTPFFLILLFGRSGRALAATEEQVIGLRPLLTWSATKVTLLLITVLVATIWYWSEPTSAIGSDWVSNRIVLAGLAGFALACGGTLLQTLFRNPLASPDISGVSTCAVMFIACLLVVYPGASQGLLTLAGLAGALMVIGLLFWGLKLQLSVSQLALFGIVISAFTGTATHILLTFGSTTSTVTLMWLSGTTYGASAQSIVPLAATLLVALMMIAPILRSLDIMPLGEIIPQVVGVALRPYRLMLLAVAATLTAVAISSVGAISFVGLLAPHCARLLGLYRHVHLIPAAGLTGAILLIWADGLGRSLMPPFEIAAGLVVSILGSFYFLLLLFIGYRKQSYGTN
ncbi:iron ABC transporter permease [Shewanella sp. VB17]|uniref:iron ABC transporter permease n=1 Tax=Shewanella sp. VB17 TaxID=2739432 RepID=UPI001565471C|nr:iron ABC transporter permease [Shewanella sp. VB17]NRD75334.1 iron ABC transporter permease [Shewanella sp. VB17]